MSFPRQRLLPGQVPVLLRVLLPAQIFTVFLTGTKLIPGIRNNFGPFEIVGLAMVLAALAVQPDALIRMLENPIIKITALMTLLALISLVQFQGPNLSMGIVQTLILAFMTVFVGVVYRLMLRFQISPQQLLRLVTYAALIIGPWVLFAGVAAQGDIQEAGPFRNRAHMANYMLTAFWLVLLYNLWPGISKRERLLSYLALASTLYPIAVSGRRSVYLSLIIGLVGVALAFLGAVRGYRRSAIASAIVIFVMIGTLYSAGPRWLPQLGFFQSRVSGIGERVGAAVGATSEAAQEQGFFALQRQGVLRAFRDSPLTGIGWGAFYMSAYSPTGHEVHSMPLRFLAELGLIGFGLYIALMSSVLLGTIRILRLLYHSPYRMPAIVLTIALWSLSVSYVYNRHITERTFWLLLIVYLSLEAFARSQARLRQLAARRIAAEAGRVGPGRAAARAPLDPGRRRGWTSA